MKYYTTYIRFMGHTRYCGFLESSVGCVRCGGLVVRGGRLVVRGGGLAVRGGGLALSGLMDW